MKHYPRIRKTVKWTSAAMVVVLVVAWACSLFVWAECRRDGWTIALQRHGFGILYDSDPYVRRNRFVGWGALPLRFHAQGLWFAFLGLDRPSAFFSPHPPSIVLVQMPFWPFVLALVVIWRADRWGNLLWGRLKKKGLCVKCGYDRAGIVATVACPECGETPRT